MNLLAQACSTAVLSIVIMMLVVLSGCGESEVDEPAGSSGKVESSPGQQSDRALPDHDVSIAVHCLTPHRDDMASDSIGASITLSSRTGESYALSGWSLRNAFVDGGVYADPDGQPWRMEDTFVTINLEGEKTYGLRCIPDADHAIDFVVSLSELAWVRIEPPEAVEPDGMPSRLRYRIDAKVQGRQIQGDSLGPPVEIRVFGEGECDVSLTGCP